MAQDSDCYKKRSIFYSYSKVGDDIANIGATHSLGYMRYWGKGFGAAAIFQAGIMPNSSVGSGSAHHLVLDGGIIPGWFGKYFSAGVKINSSTIGPLGRGFWDFFSEGEQVLFMGPYIGTGRCFAFGWLELGGSLSLGTSFEEFGQFGNNYYNGHWHIGCRF